ncbi:effector binding domain-containing protein [Flavobacterium sp. MAH-1]|uniref:Effector binding domain-containing protein n=1 Tax=Flavobacterium agri TaxID=2743471 RepID=A0A7Y8XZ79_9FLAO|nr:GyrI-like domain-containing protein [Flavobacterium agri]NUY79416.1 effector binding domain-containing protein [Flavobacterium agri]NYA69441.1 effector binding domain-containing protein [Flavobacterium agri]
MRILKYIFLLIVLALVGVTVFVATQKGNYEIVSSRVVKSPRSVVYGYVNDFRNWENFIAWAKDDASAKFTFPAVTSGKGGSASWKSGDGEGKIATYFAKDNDSLFQKMEFNGSPSEISWKFEDVVGGTKVTWKTKGKVNFWYKVQSVAKGGLERMLGAMNEQSLANLDKTLVYEVNTYSISENGTVYKSGSKFLKKTILSTIANAPKNMRIMLSKMQFFFRKNDISAYGKPFILYHSYDTANGLTRFSVCMPVKDEIRTAPGSDISFGEFDAMKSIKVTLNGDYSHRPEAWQRASDYISKAKLERDPNIRVIEVLNKNIEDTKSPSKWVTHIYFPIRSIAQPPKPAVTRQPVEPKPAENSTDEFSIQ